jgi:hypothetical protein
MLPIQITLLLPLPTSCASTPLIHTLQQHRLQARGILSDKWAISVNRSTPMMNFSWTYKVFYASATGNTIDRVRNMYF